ncbi:MAG: bifunctional serine/threonine-protein kinase/formylglycine-generating enzyme family protein, partial [Polyangiaceae bacterium]
LESVLADERQKKLPARSPSDAVALLDPVAEALALAHRKGLAHRDVKPPNIFILGDPRGDGCPVKLLDFGIAKVVQDAQKMAGAFQKTSGVVTSFTPAYGAPEQFSRTFGATGPWTDVFALGLILSQMASGRAPLQGDDVSQLAYAAMDEKNRPTPRALGVADVSDAVEAAMARALAVKIDERPQNARDMWTELIAAIRGESRSFTPIAVAATVIAPMGEIPAAAKTNAEPRELVPLPERDPILPKGQLYALLGVLGLAGLSVAVAVYTMRPGKDAVAPLASAQVVVDAGASVAVVGGDSSSALGAIVDSGRCPAGMAPIPGGQYFMGSDDGEKEEMPAHAVMLMPYCMDVHEVTVQQYLACSSQGLCKRASTTNEWKGISASESATYDPLCNIRDPQGKEKHPINCVSWEMAALYCSAEGARLPTEAEWEFAARGPDGRKYPWGDEIPTGGHLNACGTECVAWGKQHDVALTAMYPLDDHFPTTSPVGSFPAGASRYGIQDVAGNVWEWVSDWYGPYKPTKVGLPETNPKGPVKGTAKVMRGGAWNSSDASWLRPSFRYSSAPTRMTYGIGFRCAKGL